MWVGITRGTTVNRPSAVRKFGENVQLTKPFVDSSYMLDILILYVNSPHTTVQDGINPPFVAMRVVKKAMIVERIYQGTDKILFCHHVIFNDCCQTGISFLETWYDASVLQPLGDHRTENWNKSICHSYLSLR